MVDQTIAELAPMVGLRAACTALGRARATYYRHHRQSSPPPRATRTPRPQPRALSPSERAEVLDILHQERFIDQAPATIHSDEREPAARAPAPRIAVALARWPSSSHAPTVTSKGASRGRSDRRPTALPVHRRQKAQGVGGLGYGRGHNQGQYRPGRCRKGRWQQNHTPPAARLSPGWRADPPSGTVRFQAAWTSAAARTSASATSGMAASVR
jgi:hypothetical protein